MDKTLDGFIEKLNDAYNRHIGGVLLFTPRIMPQPPGFFVVQGNNQIGPMSEADAKDMQQSMSSSLAPQRMKAQRDLANEVQALVADYREVLDALEKPGK